jgi:LmbE family N-acetylglucosaminyl deacetylase
MISPNESLKGATLIVAHPDDEVLWFSSILDAVDKIVICFTDAEHWPGLGEARKRSLAEHPYRDRIVELGLSQVKTHNKSSWPEPVQTEYGLLLDKNPRFDEPYKTRATRLLELLESHVREAKNIYTHNPWGEYGHEDHVQVSHLAKTLANKHKTAIWHSNYVSNKSSALMRRYVRGFGMPYFTMRVDTVRAREIADTYFRNGAWTWFEEYVWFASEAYVAGPLEPSSQSATGAIFPVNYLRLPLDLDRQACEQPSIYQQVKRLFKSKIRIEGHPAVHSVLRRIEIDRVRSGNELK